MLIGASWSNLVAGDCHGLRAHNEKFGALLRETDKHFSIFLGAAACCSGPSVFLWV